MENVYHWKTLFSGKLHIEKKSRRKKSVEDLDFMTVGRPGRPKTGRERITLMLSPQSIAIIKRMKERAARADRIASTKPLLALEQKP